MRASLGLWLSLSVQQLGKLKYEGHKFESDLSYELSSSSLGKAATHHLKKKTWGKKVSWLLGTCFPYWISSPSLHEGGGAWSSFNLITHALFTPMGGLALSGWR